MKSRIDPGPEFQRLAELGGFRGWGTRSASRGKEDSHRSAGHNRKTGLPVCRAARLQGLPQVDAAGRLSLPVRALSSLELVRHQRGHPRRGDGRHHQSHMTSGNQACSWMREKPREAMLSSAWRKRFMQALVAILLLSAIAAAQQKPEDGDQTGDL